MPGRLALGVTSCPVSGRRDEHGRGRGRRGGDRGRRRRRGRAGARAGGRALAGTRRLDHGGGFGGRARRRGGQGQGAARDRGTGQHHHQPQRGGGGLDRPSHRRNTPDYPRCTRLQPPRGRSGGAGGGYTTGATPRRGLPSRGCPEVRDSRPVQRRHRHPPPGVAAPTPNRRASDLRAGGRVRTGASRRYPKDPGGTRTPNDPTDGPFGSLGRIPAWLVNERPSGRSLQSGRNPRRGRRRSGRRFQAGWS